MNDITSPVYARIALDIAMRIAHGELKKNTKIYGRSVMSSEYGVSPETIRKAMKLLEDMEIVDVKHNSGAVVLSPENAQRYVERFGVQNNLRTMRHKLKELLKEHSNLSKEIINIASSISKTNEKFSETNPFKTYEIEIPEDCFCVGHTIGELSFWQQTGATIIALRRGDKIILSPGPYAIFETNDIIIFIGDVNCIKAVNEFINK